MRMETNSEWCVYKPRHAEAAARIWRSGRGQTRPLSHQKAPALPNFDSRLPASDTDGTDFHCFKPCSLWTIAKAALGTHATPKEDFIQKLASEERRNLDGEGVMSEY